MPSPRTWKALLLLFGVVLLAAPPGIWQPAPTYEFTVTAPENATYEPTGNRSYATLSERSQSVFRTALESEDGTHVVRGEANAPDDIAYLTDYYPAPGVYNVSYQGDHYVMVASAQGGFGGVFVTLALRGLGLFTVLTGAVLWTREWDERALAAHALGASLFLAVGLGATWVLEETPLLLGAISAVALAALHAGWASVTGVLALVRRD